MVVNPPDGWKEAVTLLGNPKSAKRRSGAKRLRKMAFKGSTPHLLEALRKELTDSRTWETQYQMIMALGESGAQDSLQFLESLTLKDFEATMVYSAIGDALIRLSLQNKNAEPTMKGFLKKKKVLLIDGALRAFAMTRTQLSESLATELISFNQSLRGDDAATWNRTWLAAALTGANSLNAREFLENCVSSDDSQLQRAATAALAGKYLKWSPL